MRDLFTTTTLPGRTIVDAEAKVTVANGDLNIAGLTTVGWQRAGVHYPGQARVNGLAFGTRVQVGDVQSPSGSVAIADAPYVMGFFAAANPATPLTSGHSVQLVNAAEQGGKFLVGDVSQRLVTPSTKQVEFMAFVIARAQGAAYYLASLPGARNVGSYPNMRPVYLDGSGTAATLYPGVYSRAANGGHRIAHVSVETLGAPYTNWYLSAEAADTLTGSGVLGGSAAEKGSAWQGGTAHQRTATGAQRTGSGSPPFLTPPSAPGLMMWRFTLASGHDYHELNWRIDPAAPNNYRMLLIRPTSLEIRDVVNGVGYPGQTNALQSMTITLAAGVEHHVCVQDDGTNTRVWVNGVVPSNAPALVSTAGNTRFGVGFFLNQVDSRMRQVEMHPRTVPIPAELIDEAPFMPNASRVLAVQELFSGSGTMEGKVADVGGVAATRTRGNAVATRNGAGAASFGSTVSQDTHLTYPLSTGYIDMELDFTPPGSSMGDAQGTMATLALEGPVTTFTPTLAGRAYIQDAQINNTEYEALSTDAAGAYTISNRAAMALELTKGTPRTMRLVYSQTAKRYIVYNGPEPVMTGAYDLSVSRTGWGVGATDTGTLLGEYRAYTAAATETVLTPPTASLEANTTAPALTVSNNVILTPPTASLEATTTAPEVGILRNALTSSGDFLTSSGDYLVWSISDITELFPPTANLAATTTAPSLTLSGNIDLSVPTAELAATTTAPGVELSSHITLAVPSATLSATTAAPTVAVSQSVFLAPPTTTLEATTAAPTVAVTAHVSLDVPTATLTASTSAPTLVAGGNIELSVPGASLSATTAAPTITITADITLDILTATLTASTAAPTVTVSDNLILSVPTATLEAQTYAPTLLSSAIPAPAIDITSEYVAEYAVTGDYVALIEFGGGGVSQDLPISGTWVTGDTKRVRITTNRDLSGAQSIRFAIFRRGLPVVEKALGNGVTFDAATSQIVVQFSNSDTQNLPTTLALPYECEVADAVGNISTEVQGKIQFTKDLIRS